MESDDYQHVTELLRGLHGPQRNVTRPPIISHNSNNDERDDVDVILPLTNTNIIPPTINATKTKLLVGRGSSYETGRRLSSPPTMQHSRPSSTSTGTTTTTTTPLLDDHDNHHYHNFFNHHIRIPTLVVTGPQNDNNDHPHKKFSFGLRRHSHTVFFIILTGCCYG